MCDDRSMDQSSPINNLQQGKEEGLTAIYRQYKRPLLYFTLQFVDRETAEETVSDTFVKVWKLRKHFHTMEKLKAFLYISTKNACLNHLRRPQTKWNIEDIETWHEELSEDPEVYSKIVQTELLKQIYEEVDKLPQNHRDVFNMTYLEDMTVEEISKKLKISPTAVYTYRSRAIALLRNSRKIKDSLYLAFFLQQFLQ